MYYPPYPYRQPTSIKTILIITVLVLAIIVGIYFYLKKKAEDALKTELPSEYADEKYTTEESKKIRYLSAALQNDLTGLNWSHDYDIYTQLKGASDRVFEGVCVDYKRLTGVSLRKDLSSDKTSFGFAGFGEGAKLYDAVMARMDTLQVA